MFTCTIKGWKKRQVSNKGMAWAASMDQDPILAFLIGEN
jgi:hypothetical protein